MFGAADSTPSIGVSTVGACAHRVQATNKVKKGIWIMKNVFAFALVAALAACGGKSKSASTAPAASAGGKTYAAAPANPCAAKANPCAAAPAATTTPAPAM